MIHIFTTGGTIEGLEYDEEKNRPYSAPMDIEQFLKTANINTGYIIERVLAKDSRFITSKDRKILGRKIYSTKNGRFLITHGTITMVETAKYLGKLNLSKTIVLVGSFILGYKRNTDALFNMGYAICATQMLGHGVYIAMNGCIFSWENVLKNKNENRFEKEYQ